MEKSWKHLTKKRGDSGYTDLGDLENEEETFKSVNLLKAPKNSTRILFLGKVDSFLSYTGIVCNIEQKESAAYPLSSLDSELDFWLLDNIDDIQKHFRDIMGVVSGFSLPSNDKLFDKRFTSLENYINCAYDGLVRVMDELKINLPNGWMDYEGGFLSSQFAYLSCMVREVESYFLNVIQNCPDTKLNQIYSPSILMFINRLSKIFFILSYYHSNVKN